MNFFFKYRQKFLLFTLSSFGIHYLYQFDDSNDKITFFHNATMPLKSLQYLQFGHYLFFYKHTCKYLTVQLVRQRISILQCKHFEITKYCCHVYNTN